MADIKRNATNSSSLSGGSLFQHEVRYVDPRILRPHPQNTYSMDETEFRELVANIAEVGLIEWPLVREVDDGGLQILSGHRRVKAVKKLLEKDASWSEIPVRVVQGISDTDALLILHSGNMYRTLSRDERVKQFDLLRAEIAELRESHPEWHGIRSDEIMAEILGYTNAWTFKRHKRIAMRLDDEIYKYYDAGLIGDLRAYDISGKDEAYQHELAEFLKSKKPKTQKEMTLLLDQYDKGVYEWLKECSKHLNLADQALFRARDILGRSNIVSSADKDRMWAMRDTLDRMIKGTRTR